MMPFIKVNKQGLLNFFRKYGTVLCAVIIFVIFSFASENFFSSGNLLMLLRQMSMLTIIAIGFTFVMGAGGFDMSIGSAAGLINILFAATLFSTNSFWIALLAALCCGLVIGLINGALVAYIGLPDFIATFAVGSVIYGIKMLITKGSPMFFPDNVPAISLFIGQGYIGPIPFPVILMFIFVGIAIFVLNKTTLGRRIYSIGGNPVASIYAGINVKKYRLITFIICSMSVSLAAVILTSRLGSAQPLAGEEFLLDAIAVVFLSTTMFGDGEPTGEGTFVGAFVISMLNNGLTMLNVAYYFQYITKGLVVIIAVVISVVLSKSMKLKM